MTETKQRPTLPDSRFSAMATEFVSDWADVISVDDRAGLIACIDRWLLRRKICFHRRDVETITEYAVRLIGGAK